MEIYATYQHRDMTQECEIECADIHEAIRLADGAIEDGGTGSVSVVLHADEAHDPVHYSLCDIYYEVEEDSGKPYRAGVSADDIVFDGWSRGFTVEQTLEELQSMGFLTDRNAVLQTWQQYDADMEADAAKHPHADDMPGQYF